MFDAEVFATMRATRLLSKRGESGQSYTTFSDSQTVISRIQHDRGGPAQALERATIAKADDLCDQGNALTVRWTPSHEGVDGSEQADKAARLAAEGEGEGQSWSTSWRPAYLT